MTEPPESSDGYMRPGRPTDEPGNYTWRDTRNLRMRIEIIRQLRTDPDTVLALSKQALQQVRYADHLVEFWGPMILNDDVEGLIHYHVEDLPVAWYHGHPVIWPGKLG